MGLRGTLAVALATFAILIVVRNVLDSFESGRRISSEDFLDTEPVLIPENKQESRQFVIKEKDSKSDFNFPSIREFMDKMGIEANKNEIKENIYAFIAPPPTIPGTYSYCCSCYFCVSDCCSKCFGFF